MAFNHKVNIPRSQTNLLQWPQYFKIHQINHYSPDNLLGFGSLPMTPNVPLLRLLLWETLRDIYRDGGCGDYL